MLIRELLGLTGRRLGMLLGFRCWLLVIEDGLKVRYRDGMTTHDLDKLVELLC